MASVPDTGQLPHDGLPQDVTSAGRKSEASELGEPVYALFQQRVRGDDALLKLAGVRFAQMGVAAEVYADTPDQLEHVLRFVPAHPRLPVVHLNRRVNLLHERGRAVVQEFAGRFAGRIAALVVHDSREMGAPAATERPMPRRIKSHWRGSNARNGALTPGWQAGCPLGVPPPLVRPNDLLRLRREPGVPTPAWFTRVSYRAD